jgi:hypothetical protein
MWVSVPDELVDVEGFSGWADEVPLMFGCTENEARYFIRPDGPQLPFPKNIVIAVLNFLKPGGIYSWKVVKKIITSLSVAHGPQIMDILCRTGKTPYECLDWLITEIVFREPALQTYAANELTRLINSMRNSGDSVPETGFWKSR